MGFYFGRGKNKVQNPYTLKDIYKFYISDKVKGSTYDITYKQFVTICNDYYRQISDKIILGGEFKLGSQLGFIEVMKHKTPIWFENVTPVNWDLTNRIGKKVHELNEHTKGFLYRFKWTTRFSRVSNIHLYKFRMCRHNTRELAKTIKSGITDYFEIH